MILRKLRLLWTEQQKSGATKSMLFIMKLVRLRKVPKRQKQLEIQLILDLVDAKEAEGDPDDSQPGDSQDVASKKKQTKKKRLKLLYPVKCNFRF